MTLAPFDLVRFRELYPVLDAATDQQVLLWSDIAACSLVESCELGGNCYTTAWQLLTAHIGQLLLAAARGATRAGVVTSAAVDKVSVGYAPPPYRCLRSRVHLKLQGLGALRSVGVAGGHAQVYCL